MKSLASSATVALLVIGCSLSWASQARAQALRPEEAFGPRAKTTTARARGKAPTAKKTLVTAPAQAKPRAAAAPADFDARHRAALALALAGKTPAALAALRALLLEKPSDLQTNFVHLSIGRVLYGAGDANGAIAEYAQVKRGDQAWYSAVEERAWAYMKLDQPENALAQLKTLMLPIFKDRVGPEAFYLAALTHLRVCDYDSVFSTVREFKARFRPRVKEWESNELASPEAKMKLKEASETIQKLNLVEAEAIQRVYMPSEIKGHVGPQKKIVRGRDDISFPSVPRDEVWLDEVEHFQVSLKGCPQPDLARVAGQERSDKGGRSL